MPSGCVYPHPFTGMAYCVMQCVLYLYRDKCIHIGVGFDVARSTTLGNAKASKRGTSDRLVHAFLCPKSSFSLIFN